MKILGLCGSLQQKSGNLLLLETAARLAPAGTQVTLFHGMRDLPFFNPEKEAAELLPVQAWRAALQESDAVLFASPEYGHSLAGVVKNAIEWVIGSGELHQKVVAITAAVPNRDRGRLGLATLGQALRAVDVTLVGGEPTVRGPDFDASIGTLLTDLAAAFQARRG